MSEGQFYIIRLMHDGSEQPIPGYGPYPDGKTAATVAKELSVTTGAKHQPRRMAAADPDAWKARERKRMTDGTYRAWPASWAALSFPPDHFAHIDTKDQTKVAYFADNDTGILDRPVVTTPGRYLTLVMPGIADLRLKELIADIDNMTDLQFAFDSKEIRRVYEQGPRSCMASPANAYNTRNIHPVEAYGAGDLAVAFIEKNGSISARAMCHPEKKYYGTIYGDKARMEGQFKKLGYVYKADFEPGIRIKKFPLSDDKNNFTFILPYFDNCGSMIDKGDHFETFCGRHTTVDQQKLRGLIVVTGSSGGSGRGTAGRYCPKNGNFQNLGEGWDTVILADGREEEWSRSAREYHATPYTPPGERKARYYDKAACRQVYAKPGASAQYIPNTIADEVAFLCFDLKRWYLNDQLAETDDKGNKVSKEAMKHKAETEARRAREKTEYARYQALLKREREAAIGAKAKSIKASPDDVFGDIAPKPKRKVTVESVRGGVSPMVRLNGGGASLTGFTTFVGNSAVVGASNEEVLEGV